MKKIINYIFLGLVLIMNFTTNYGIAPGRTSTQTYPQKYYRNLRGRTRRTPIQAPRIIKVKEKAVDTKTSQLKKELQDQIDKTEKTINDPQASQEEKEKEVQNLEKKEQEAKGYIESIKNYFGYGPEAEKKRKEAEVRLQQNTQLLSTEKQRYAQLTDEKDKKTSLALQRKIEEEIKTDEIALGKRWSTTQKITYGTIGTAGLLLADWYFGTGIASSAVAKGQEALGAIRSHLPSWETKEAAIPLEEMSPSAIESQFIEGAYQPGLLERTGENVQWITGKVSQLRKPDISQMTWTRAAGALGSAFVINTAINRAQMIALGFVLNKVTGMWEKQDPKTGKMKPALNPDGTPYIPTEGIAGQPEKSSVMLQESTLPPRRNPQEPWQEREKASTRLTR